jgi:hypothetical protein
VSVANNAASPAHTRNAAKLPIRVLVMEDMLNLLFCVKVLADRMRGRAAAGVQSAQVALRFAQRGADGCTGTDFGAPTPIRLSSALHE